VRRVKYVPLLKVPLTRAWFNFVAGLSQVITDFEQGGGVAALLEAWTEDEWRRAQDQLHERQRQLRRIAEELRAGKARLGQPRQEGLRVLRGADA
jgi:hypothetical protein